MAGKAGKIAFRAIVDPKNEIKETNEKNNTAFISFSVLLKVPMATVIAIPARGDGRKAKHSSKGKITRAQITHVKIYNVKASVKGSSLNTRWNRKSRKGARVKILLYPGNKSCLAKVDRGTWVSRNTPNNGHFSIPLARINQSGRFVVRVQTTDNLSYGDSNSFILTHSTKVKLQKGKLAGKLKQTNRPSAKATPINLSSPRPRTTDSTKHEVKTYTRSASGYGKTARGSKNPQFPNHPLPPPSPNPGDPEAGDPIVKAILSIKSIDITPSSPRAGHDIARIRVTVKNTGPVRMPYRCTLNFSVYTCDDDGNPIL